MFNVTHIFRLTENTTVQTEGGTVTAHNIAGRSYTEGDHFNGEHTPTYIIEGQNGGFEVKQDDVTEIITITN